MYQIYMFDIQNMNQKSSDKMDKNSNLKAYAKMNKFSNISNTYSVTNKNSKLEQNNNY